MLKPESFLLGSLQKWEQLLQGIQAPSCTVAGLCAPARLGQAVWESVPEPLEGLQPSVLRCEWPWPYCLNEQLNQSLISICTQTLLRPVDVGK